MPISSMHKKLKNHLQTSPDISKSILETEKVTNFTFNTRAEKLTQIVIPIQVKQQQPLSKKMSKKLHTLVLNNDRAY